MSREHVVCVWKLVERRAAQLKRRRRRRLSRLVAARRRLHDVKNECRRTIDDLQSHQVNQKNLRAGVEKRKSWTNKLDCFSVYSILLISKQL